MALYHINTTYTNVRVAERFTELKTAIRHTRMWAAQLKQSCTLYKTDKTGNQEHIPIGIAEFPNYLRHLELNWKEIHLYRIDKY